MIPFPGESIGLDFAFGASSLYNSIRRRGGIGTATPTRTLSSGEQWRAWVYDDSQTYLEETDAAVTVSWVVEVAGGSGTIDASTGLDPDYGDSTAAHPTSLGTHTVTAGTLVLPTSYTAADVISGGASMMLVLDCTAGSVVVQQIKLRVWPTSGVVGGWSDPNPGFDTSPQLAPVKAAGVFRDGATATGSVPEDVWDAAMAATITNGGGAGGVGPHTTSTIDYGVSVVGGVAAYYATAGVSPFVRVDTSIDGLTTQVTTVPHGVIAVAQGQDAATQSPIGPDLDEGVDYIRPPTEVQGDFNYYVQQDGGVRALQWVNTELSVQVLAAPVPITGPTVTLAYTDTTPYVGDDIDEDMVEGGAVVTASTVDTYTPVPLAPAGRWVEVFVSHAMTSTGVPWPGLAPFTGTQQFPTGYVVWFGVGTPGADFLALSSYVSMPPYQVWVPSIARIIPLRQFHRDDGLGVTPPRAYGGASRNRTRRAYGYA